MIESPQEPLLLDDSVRPAPAPLKIDLNKAAAAPPIPQPRKDPESTEQSPHADVPRERHVTGRRLLWIALLIVLVGAATGGGVGLLVGPTYAAEADVLYPITTSQPSGSLLHDDRSLTTQVILIKSHTVLDPVVAAHGVTFDDLGRILTAEVIDGSDVLRIQVRSRSRTTGVALVDAIVTSYLRVAADPARKQTEDYLNAQLADVRAQINRPALAGGASAAASLAARQQDLLSQLDKLHIAAIGDTSPRILVSPFSIADAVGFTPALKALAGGLTGVLAAAALIVLVVRRHGWG